MSATGRLLDAARRYPSTWPSEPIPARPSTGVAVVACMDARIDVYSLFGLAPGDAHVIRNAGGLVTDDTVRSLTISQRCLATTGILVVHHTRCGMEGLDDEGLAADIERETGRRPAWTAGGFADAYEDVRRSVEILRGCPFLPSRDLILGFVFDVDSGRLDEVPGA